MVAVEAVTVVVEQEPVIEFICLDSLFESYDEFIDRIAPEPDLAHLGDIGL